MLYKLVRIFSKIFYGVFFRYKAYGVENVPKEGAAILCANHLSNFDPISVALNLNRLPAYISKKELFENKLLAKLLGDLKAFPVDRDKMDMKAVKTALKVLKEGELLGVFAQGTRVKGDEDVAAKAGVALFALKSGAPVIPVGIKTTYKLFSRVEVYFGEPMTFEEYAGKKFTSEELGVIAENIMDEVYKLIG